MKKLILTSLIAVFLSSSFTANVKEVINNDLENFYLHLGKNIKYPSSAKAKNIQGNSLILFSVKDGKLEGLKIENELGSNCDTEVLNQMLSYKDYKPIKDGKYALKVTFKLQGADTEIKNKNIETPDDYAPLALTIVAYTPSKK